MKNFHRNYLSLIVLGAALAVSPITGSAQNKDDRRADERHDGDRHENNQSYRFRSEDRDHFRPHYESNVRQWEQHPDRRHHVRAGEHLPADYRSRLKPVPTSYYRDLPPVPRGYRMGYYDGYVVAYDPTTQIVADVLDLVGAATRH